MQQPGAQHAHVKQPWPFFASSYSRTGLGQAATLSMPTGRWLLVSFWLHAGRRAGACCAGLHACGRPKSAVGGLVSSSQLPRAWQRPGKNTGQKEESSVHGAVRWQYACRALLQQNAAQHQLSTAPEGVASGGGSTKCKQLLEGRLGQGPSSRVSGGGCTAGRTICRQLCQKGRRRVALHNTTVVCAAWRLGRCVQCTASCLVSCGQGLSLVVVPANRKKHRMAAALHFLDQQVACFGCFSGFTAVV
jgi:hypothetical protein